MTKKNKKKQNRKKGKMTKKNDVKNINSNENDTDNDNGYQQKLSANDDDYDYEDDDKINEIEFLKYFQPSQYTQLLEEQPKQIKPDKQLNKRQSSKKEMPPSSPLPLPPKRVSSNPNQTVAKADPLTTRDNQDNKKHKTNELET